MRFLKILSLLPMLFTLVSGCNQEKTKPNILFIFVDDLRAELGCYGNNHVTSPNLDRLAGDGYLFTNHFVNVPTCGASRHCLLTGQLPATKSHLGNLITTETLSVSEEKEEPETFIHHLRRNGWYTVGLGKITHHPDGYVYGYMEPKSSQPELPYSWDEMLLDHGNWGTGHNAFFGYAGGTNRNTLNKQVKPYEMTEGPDEAYPDGLTANLAIKKLKELKKKEKPFFLGVGFFKPHLPFNAPKKYWDLYNEDTLPVAPFAAIPEFVSRKSLHASGEFNQYALGEEKASLDMPVSDAYARKLRHGYFACISYIDAQIGRLLNELDNLELADNTIVVVWGDHGWHLGDHLVWGKHTIFDRALKSAFIIKVPGKNSGKNIPEIVSTTDIYPTLMELCTLETNTPLDGKSLINLIKDPTDDNTWRNTAYSFFRNGISLRTDRYRLNRYFRNDTIVTELFDHEFDSNETVNIADIKPEVVQQLLPVWEKGNTGLYDQE